MSDFSAAPSALGYFFQARKALFAILDSHEDADVVVEGLDDIQLSTSSGRLTLEQLKQHLGRVANLTDASSDLWKTLRVWSTHLAAGLFDPAVTSLMLVTTGTAPVGSIASLLRDGPDRNIDGARDRLNAVAQGSTNAGLREAFAAFTALTNSQQTELLESVWVCDSTPSILDIESEIKLQIRYATRRQFLDAVYERLEGWWFGRITQQLAATAARTPISHTEVALKLIDVAEQFQEDALPIDFLDAKPDELDGDSDQRLFVRQLRAVNKSKERIEFAITDYYRAFSQRARWLNEDLLIDTDLDDYENRLFEAWSRYQTMLRDEDGLDTNDAAQCISFGSKLLRWMEFEADIPIRPKVTEGYVMRGSYHMLADRTEPRIWWHPMFLERLAKVTR
jgi:hypothetical protein